MTTAKPVVLDRSASVRNLLSNIYLINNVHLLKIISWLMVFKNNQTRLGVKKIQHSSYPLIIDIIQRNIQKW